MEFKLWLENVQKGNKYYWISSSGQIISPEFGESHHFLMVWNRPELFGLSKTVIQQILDKHKEMPGQEGNAKDEICNMLLNRGWIRVRYRQHPQEHWIAQALRIDNRCLNNLSNWALEMMHVGDLYPSDLIVITSPSESKQMLVKDLSKSMAA